MLLCSLLCWSCYDELGQIGQGIQPPGDLVRVYADTFSFSAKTIQSDSIYARSSMSLLGELYDPFYGSIKSDYLCRFYNPPESGVFLENMVDERIDSVTLEIDFLSWIGDSLTLMQAAVYPVKKNVALPNGAYTNVNIADYVDMSTPWGKKNYTAHNEADTLQKRIIIRLPDYLGKEFYEAAKEDNDKNPFKNLESFNNFFPGVYITTTGGTGNILNIAITSLVFNYNIIENDSIKKRFTVFSATREVTQLNKVDNYNLDQMLNDQSSAYLKTPAGVYTVVGIPVKAIKEDSKGESLNNVTFKIKTAPRGNKEGYGLSAPPYLLMLPKDSIINFFEKRRVADSKSSFLTAYDSTQLTYSYGNITAFINELYSRYENKDTVEVALVPVSIVQESGGAITSINNYMVPSTAEIRLDPEFIQIPVVSSNF